MNEIVKDVGDKIKKGPMELEKCCRNDKEEKCCTVGMIRKKSAVGIRKKSAVYSRNDKEEKCCIQ